MRTASPSRCVLAALAAGCFLIWAGRLPAQSNVEELWREASGAQQAGQYSRAAALYKKILELQPDLIEAEVNLGLMDQLTGDSHAAISSFDRALTRDKSLYAPNLMAGLDYLKLDSPGAALPYLQRAVASRPQSAEALAGLANACLQLHRFSEAEEQFRKAVKLNDGRNADAWYGLGATYLSIEKEAEGALSHASSPFRDVLLSNTYLEQGLHEKAIETLKLVAAAPGSVPCVHTLLGIAYLRDAQFGNAAAQFENDWDRESASGCLLAKLGIAAVLAEQSNIDGAVSALREAVEIDPGVIKSNVELFWSSFTKAGLESRVSAMLSQTGNSHSHGAQLPLANRYWTSGHYTSCSSALTPSISLTTRQLRLLSRCSYYIGSDELVLKSTEELLKLAPADPEALYWRAQSAERLGLEALTTAKKTNPDSASLYALSGDMLRGKGDLSEAAREYRTAIGLKPDFVAAHLGLARVLDSDHDPAGAEKELDYVLKVNSDDPEANYLMGELLLNRGDSDGALPLLQKALHLNSDELPYVHSDLSRIYDERGDTKRAISELESALPADNDGSYHYRLGRLYLKAGDRKAADRAMQESERLHQSGNSSGTSQKP